MSTRSPSIVLLLAAVLPLAAQEPDRQSAARPFGVETSAVVIDVVVRDKKGNPVTDLARADFELREDCVEQEIADVSLVAPEAGPARATSPEAAHTIASAPAQRAAAASSPTPHADYVALVFDRLSPEGRALAYKGALSYIDSLGDDPFLGVFVADLSLETIQPYTQDRARIRGAIERVAVRATANFARDDPLIRKNSAWGDSHPDTPYVASADSAGRPVVRNEATELSIAATRNSWEALDRDNQGYATTNALLAVVPDSAPCPGARQ